MKQEITSIHCNSEMWEFIVCELKRKLKIKTISPNHTEKVIG